MSRSQRLLQLMQLLRLHRYPVTAARLAKELEVSERTIYRDIATLKDQGAWIDGEPGMGYVLRPGFMLPPMMFTEDEIEALAVGSQWVRGHTDTKLATAAEHALAKIGAVLPTDLRERLSESGLLVPAIRETPTWDRTLRTIREAISTEHRLQVRYLDLNESTSERTIWPIALAFFDQVRVVVSWCELREDYRSFRVDRMQSISLLGQRYPRRRQAMLSEWKIREGIAAESQWHS